MWHHLSWKSSCQDSFFFNSLHFRPIVKLRMLKCHRHMIWNDSQSRSDLKCNIYRGGHGGPFPPSFVLQVAIRRLDEVGLCVPLLFRRLCIFMAVFCPALWHTAACHRSVQVVRPGRVGSHPVTRKGVPEGGAVAPGIYLGGGIPHDNHVCKINILSSQPTPR